MLSAFKDMDMGTPLDEMSPIDMVSLGITYRQEQLERPTAKFTPVGSTPEMMKHKPRAGALAALKAEVPVRRLAVQDEIEPPEVKTQVVTYDGEQWVIDSPDTWGVELFELVEDQKIVTFLRAVLGPVQWTRYKSKKRNAQSVADMYEAVQNSFNVSGDDLKG